MQLSKWISGSGVLVVLIFFFATLGDSFLREPGTGNAKWSQMGQDVRAQEGNVSTEVGFWFTMVGLGLIVLGGVLAWLERPAGNYQDPYGYTGGYYQ